MPTSKYTGISIIFIITEFTTTGTLPAASGYIPLTTAGNEKYRHAGSVVVKLFTSNL